LPSVPLYCIYNNKDNEVSTKKRNNNDLHDPDIISILIGSLLGDLYAERRGPSTRFPFKQSHIHEDYINFLHVIFDIEGYCSCYIQQRIFFIKKKF